MDCYNCYHCGSAICSDFWGSNESGVMFVVFLVFLVAFIILIQFESCKNG